MLICCDGVFESLTDTMAVAFIQQRLSRGESAKQAAVALVDECLRKDNSTRPSLDNITAVRWGGWGGGRGSDCWADGRTAEALVG